MNIFLGLQILIGNEWVQNQAVIVEDKLIKAILPVDLIETYLPAKIYEFPNDYFLIPGLIDLHIHGMNGHDVMDGTKEALQGLSQALVTEGVTGFLATTMTATSERLEVVLKNIAESIQVQPGILGIHLEGPFISHKKMGAQAGDAISIPDISLIKQWQKAANNAIKLVTLAPELPQAKSLIKMLKDMDIIISVGHTNATFAETQEAIELGCSHATHLFNAMRSLHQREPGASGALLLSDKVSAEFIVDGFHLHPAIVDFALRIKGKEKFILVSDAMRAKCLGDGEYELGGQTVTVYGNKVTLADGTIAGSVLSMRDAIINTVQYTKCSLIDAINMASLNPAKVLGLSERKGKIEKGKDADLVVMNSDFEVVMTIREGEIVFNKMIADKEGAIQDEVYDVRHV